MEAALSDTVGMTVLLQQRVLIREAVGDIRPPDKVHEGADAAASAEDAADTDAGIGVEVN